MISRRPPLLFIFSAMLWPALAASASPEYRFTFSNPAIGSQDAPWVLEYFSAPDCAPCLRFEQDDLADLLPQVASGRLRIVFRDLPASLTDANLARRLFCLQELPQSPDQLIENRLQLKSTAGEASLPSPLPGRSAARWQACISGLEADEIALHNLEIFSSRGFHATPSFVLVASDEPRRPALALTGRGAPAAVRAAVSNDSFDQSLEGR
ncbi:MAG: hypothetical protein EA417_07795 [Gammaproteobacteria bacterium]|nr:MAG: hypothetical protein EA417_07795 [Gammaproteobacteria bacterium]